MRIQEVMNKDVAAVRPNDSAESAWTRMHERGIHHLAVRDGGAIVGVISDRDLGGARGAKTRNGRSVSDLMTKQIVTAAPTTTIRQAANMMRNRVVGCLLVTEGAKLRGIITVSDLLDLIGRGLEVPGRTWERTGRRKAIPSGYPRRKAPRRPRPTAAKSPRS